MANYFDAYEAVDELIDDVNTEYYEGCYEEIYEEICRRVDEGELSLEDGEILNEAAAQKYLYFEKTKKEEKKKMEANAERRKTLKKVGIGVAATGAGVGLGVAAHKTGLDRRALNGVKTVGAIAKSKLPTLKKKPNGGKEGDAPLQ